MSRRAVVVGAAFGVAALVLAASVFLGPPAGTDDGPPPDDGGIGTATPSGLPAEGGPPGASARDWQYQTIESVGDDKTRITLFSAASASTRGQGITYMVRPRFRIITTEYADRQTGVDAQGQPILERVAVGGQAMLLSADTAEMEMEGNEPQRGVFQGAVVVTLLKADGRAVVIDPDDPRFGEDTDIQEVFIDGDTRFGLDTNDIRSDAPVHVTSPQADFYGIGLVLKYNTARERIEQLVVSEGRYLMFDPDAERGGGVLGQGGDDDNTPALPADGPPDAQPEGGDTETDNTPAGPSQYYLATFHDNVIVRDTDRALLEGATLDIRFSLGREAVEPEPVRPVDDADSTTGYAPLPEAIYGTRLVQANNAQPPLPAPFNPALIPQQNRDRSRYTAAPHEGVLITWTGPLRLSPLDEKPEQLADDRDLDIELAGQNAYAQGMRDGKVHRVEGTNLRYLVSAERVVAAGNDARPLTILSTEAGTLTGTGELVVNIQDGTATIVGPGTLTQNPDEDGKQLTLAWTERVDLDLFIEKPSRDDAPADPNERTTGQTRIAGLRAATFVGQVTAQHPDFDLAADQLAIDLQRPDKVEDIQNDPTRIQATGHVVVHAQGDAEDEQFAITCESLAIALSHDVDGAVYAESMRAVAGVRLERPGSFLTCHRIDVAFAPPSETDTPEPPEVPEGEDGEAQRDPRYAQVRQVVAVGEVRAQVRDEERNQTINLVADHMLADVANDRLTLYATEEGELAELIDVQDDRLLRGRLIDLDDRAQVVRVEGPGALSARMEDPERPGNPQANMTVQWSNAMRFNNANGKAHFQGDVHATTRRTADTTDMTCDDLEVWFTEAPADDADADADHPAGDDDQLNATGRNVRLAIAKGDVRFVAATRAAETPDQPNSRVTIAGPELVFTNTPVDILGAPLPTPVETVVVNGQGYMFIEDYRPPDEDDPDDAPETTDNPAAVAFTGRGQTAFRWTEQMELDARANTATFIGDARMDHDPTPKDRGNHDDVHMDCRQLAADMHDTGGLGVWMSDDAPAPEISVVTAEGPLSIIRAGRQITGDHLRYVAADERVEVWADENRDVLIQEVNSPAPARCGRVIWDLAHNRIEMRNARGGVAPAGR